MVVYRDEYNATTGTITRKVGIKVLDGTENWVFSTSTLGSPAVYSDTTITNRLIGTVGISTHFLNNQNLNVYGGSFYGVSTQRINFALMGIGNEDLTSWTQFLADQYNAGHPVVIIYPLAEPTTETVTGQPLTMQAGTNIVEITQASIDNLGLEVSYKAGVAVTITEVENAQLSNSVTVTIGG